MEFNPNKAIYLQIRDAICERILSGELKSDDRIPSVREYGSSIGVNPNTVQKSFEELERSGAVYSVRGSGWYAAEDTSIAKAMLDAIVSSKVAAFFEEMKSLGVDCGKVREYMEEYCHE